MKVDILDHAAGHVEEILNGLHPGFTFHNILHTYEVVSASKIIGKACGLNEEEMEIVLIAAWYHDSGFWISPHNHEDHSTAIASQFLVMHKVSSDRSKAVISCIQATKIPQSPADNLQAVLCDADMFHLSGDQYWLKNQALRREQEFIRKKCFRDDQWCHENLNFLTQHHFHTEYGLRVLTEGKRKHMNENVRQLEALKVL